MYGLHHHNWDQEIYHPYSLDLIAAPVGEPLTVDEVRAQLKLPDEEPDEFIQRLITTARSYFEEIDNRRLITQTWRLSLTHWPAFYIELPVRPVHTVDSIKYLDTDGVQQTLDPALYQIDFRSFMPRIYRAYNQLWPQARYFPNSIEVQFQAGYALGTLLNTDDFLDGLSLRPSWASEFTTSLHSAAGFTATFVTAAPANATLDYVAIEILGTKSIPFSGTVEVTEGATTQAVSYPDPYPGAAVVNGAIPDPLKHALLLHIGHLYEHREDTIEFSRTGGLQSIPLGYEALIGARRRMQV